jgi:hypothetical protein
MKQEPISLKVIPTTHCFSIHPFIFSVGNGLNPWREDKMIRHCVIVPCIVLLPCCVANMLLSCCVATTLCCNVLLTFYAVVLGLSLCSVVLSLLSSCVFSPIFVLYSFFFTFKSQAPSPQEACCFLVGHHCK